MEGIGRFRELWQNYKRGGLGGGRDVSSKIGRIGDFLLAREGSLRVMLSLMMVDEESSEEETLILVKVGWGMRRLGNRPLTPGSEGELDRLGDDVYREPLVLVERFKPRLKAH